VIDAVFFIVALLGLAAGGFLVARNPTFWVGLAMVVWKKLAPIVFKRMPEEDEKKIQEAARRGEDTGKLWLELKRKRQKKSSST
jgi:hypothetical protein